MSWQWVLASLHLVALAVGSAGIVDRAVSLRGSLDNARIRRALIADSLWGLAALLWISTGLLRAFAGFEKGSSYYLDSTAFRVKMTLLGIILLLEIWPMISFIRWRSALGRGDMPDTRNARIFARISAAQILCVVLMVFAATAMARGLGY
jgi:putative membrane protein